MQSDYTKDVQLAPARRMPSQGMMLGYPVIAQGTKFSNVTTTFGADDHHQRDKGSEE